MSDLRRDFEKAQSDVHSLAERPDNDTLLKLYALFKQATQGDASGERPGAFDFVKRAKFDAWSALAGTTREDAMRRYIDAAKSLGGGPK